MTTPAPRSWSFTVPGSPKTKRGPAPGRHGQMHASRGTNDYEMVVAGLASSAGLAAGAGPCEVRIGIVLPTRHRKDADRVTSAIFDGLKRAGRDALEDDNLCVVQRLVVELVGVDPLCPCAVVTVTMLDRDRSLPAPRGETPAAIARSPLAAADFPEGPWPTDSSTWPTGRPAPSSRAARRCYGGRCSHSRMKSAGRTVSQMGSHGEPWAVFSLR